MANSPPLPAGFPAGFPGAAASPAVPMPPSGFQFPAGTKVIHPLPPFPKDVADKLEAARRSGSYCITVTISTPTPEDPGLLECNLFRVGNFKKDWLLRTWQTITGLFWTHDMKLPGFDAKPPEVAPAPPAPASESVAANG